MKKNKKTRLIIGVILLWFIIFGIILYNSYMSRVDKAFHHIKEIAQDSKVLRQELGTIKEIKYNNFMQWVSKIDNYKCLKLKIYTNKGTYKVCAVIDDKDVKTIANLKVAVYLINGQKFDENTASLSKIREIRQKVSDGLNRVVTDNVDAVGIDEVARVVIIELNDNSEDEQKWFKENIYDSEYIVFKISKKALNEINDKIIEYFQTDNHEYKNLSHNYVDEKERVVVVGLLENTKEQQNKFRELVIDSEYIRFEKGDGITLN